MTNYNIIKHWATPMLQGITYWLGYTSIYFKEKNKIIKESAIITEASKIINANLKNEKIETEVMYNKIVNTSKKKFNKKRVDILISSDENKYIIEVKRYKSGKKEIHKDITRLQDALENSNNLKAFLLIVSENKLPKYFVTEKGVADRKNYALKNNFFYKTRRVCKTNHTFKSKEKANFSCLIEVYRK